MKCLLCKGDMERSGVPYTVDRKGYHLYVEKIPGYVCSRCGERYFEEREVPAIQDMLRTFEAKLHEVTLAA